MGGQGSAALSLHQQWDFFFFFFSSLFSFPYGESIEKESTVRRRKQQWISADSLVSVCAVNPVLKNQAAGEDEGWQEGLKINMENVALV